jgi:hypothetical protein
MVAVVCEVRHLSPGRITRMVTRLWFRAFVRRASCQTTSKNDINTTMKEISHNTAGAIVLTGHLRAKRPSESVRNAGAFIVAQGMLTPGVLAKIKKRDGGRFSESRVGRRLDVPVRGWDGECDGGKAGGVVAGGSILRSDAHWEICRHGT